MGIIRSQLNSARWALANAEMVRNVGADMNEHQLLLRAQLLGWEPTSVHKFKPSDGIPRAAAIYVKDGLWVGMSGTDSFKQVLKYASPIAVGVGPLPRVAVKDYNLVFDSWGRKAARLIRTGLGALPNLYLSGHSYGGAVMTDAARWLRLIGVKATISLTDFGSPKVGSIDYCDPLGNVSHRRYVNTGDPIPALPPTQGELALPFKKPIQLAIRFVVPPYAYTGLGITLHADGTTSLGGTGTLTPSFVDAIVDSSLGKPVAFLEPTNHLMQEYVVRLQQAAKREITPGLFVPRVFAQFVQGPNRVAPLPAPPLPVFGPGVISMAYVSYPRKYHPRPVRIAAGTYNVFWMDQPIAGPMPLSSAKAFVRKLNWWLLRVGGNVTLNSASFIQALTLFVQVAQVGGPDWSPSPWYVL